MDSITRSSKRFNMKNSSTINHRTLLVLHSSDLHRELTGHGLDQRPFHYDSHLDMRISCQTPQVYTSISFLSPS